MEAKLENKCKLTMKGNLITIECTSSVYPLEDVITSMIKGLQRGMKYGS